jgi:putative ABC transport system permease protein
VKKALLWRKAPTSLRHFPGVLASLVVASIILAIASAAASIYFSSAGSRSVEERVREATRWTAGLQAGMGGSYHGSGVWTELEETDRMLRERASRIPHLGDRILTMLGQNSTLNVVGEDGDPMTVALLSRTNAPDYMDKLAWFEGNRVVIDNAEKETYGHCRNNEVKDPVVNGVWIATSTATQLKICPGDQVEIAFEGRTARADVQGVYLDISAAFPGKFWSNLRFAAAGQETIPAFVMAGFNEFVRLQADLKDEGGYGWQFPIQGRELTLPAARELRDDIRELRLSLQDADDPLGARFAENGGSQSLMRDVVKRAQRTLDATRGSVEFLALGGVVVALLVMGAAGVYGVRRRRVEFTALVARGMSPVALGIKAALEALVPVAAGGVVGWYLCVAVVQLVGPSARIDAGAAAEAAVRTAIALGVGLLLLSLVTGWSAARAIGDHKIVGRHRVRNAVAVIPWDLVLLGLAYASYRQLEARGGIEGAGTGAPKVDIFMLLFPVLFIAGATGLATRLMRIAFARFRSAGRHWAPFAFLASRRLASESNIALLLVTICAASIGLLVYSATLVSSGTTTVDAKALVFVGSNTATPLGPASDAPEGLSFPTTVVRKIPGAYLDNLAPVDVLGVDTETFASAVFWEDAFADKSLPDLMDGLTGSTDEKLRVYVVGEIPEDSTLSVGGATPELEVIDNLDAFPGMLSVRPLIVAERGALESFGSGSSFQGAGGRELWAKGDADKVLRELGETSLPLIGTITVDDVRQATSLLPLTWTFGFLQALGVATGLISLVGIVLYLQARQRSRVVTNALVKRMGLTAASQRASMAVELAVMLLVAFVVGALVAMLAARFAYPQLDPLPSVPPDPILDFPLILVAVVGLVVLFISPIGGWRVQRSADRANVAEVMRLVG